MEELEKYLIIGLGNPGAPYKQTRHNVGFNIVQSFADKHGMQFKHASHLIGDFAQGSFRDKKVFTLLPTTFMNSSGDAVRRCIDYFKVPLDHLIVVCDDVALPTGTMRIRSKGSCGGHNGLKSIEAHLNTEYYARLRIGVGAPGGEVLADYVLGRFSQEESKIIEAVAAKAIEVLDLWIGAGIAAAMQVANSAPKDQVKKEEGEKNG
ncbi:MAG: aminoacyl-tRNA hydrolase [Verrucomicrobia bacterium]|nr:aminoacyl-tRNA hydrolase [Verrucomicrobiota bacterium]